MVKPKKRKKPTILFKPDFFKNDIDLDNIFSTEETEAKISVLFNKFQNFSPRDFNVSHDFGEANILKDILNNIQDNHEIIFEISKMYSPSKLVSSNLQLPIQKRQSKILCLTPLVRAQVESIYTISLLLLKQKKMFKKFIRSSWANYYQIETYKIEEGKKLIRLNYNRIHRNLQELIIGNKKQHRLIKILTKNELIQIENQLKEGKIGSISQFPTPLKAIQELTKGNNNAQPSYRSSLLKVLKKRYIRYRSLCLYMHGSEMLNFAGRSLRTGEIDLVNKLNENVLEFPLRELDYLSMAIIFTIFYGYLKQPLEILLNLNEIWKEVENFSLLGKYTWETWAKKVFGQIN